VLAGDCYAPAFYEILRRKKLRIPEDISIIGFDDSPIASALLPELNTVRQPFNEMAREALRLLIEKMNDNNAPIKKILIKPELIIRNSTNKI
jgi:LacI family transcriptional regulator